MPWLHVPDALLASFAAGELDDDQAVAVALHIDDCAACQARATAAEPLARAFASVGDPPVPAELVQVVLARASREAAPPGAVVPAVGAGLAAAALLVLVLTGAPGQLVDSFSVLLRATDAVLGAVELPVAVITPIWAAAAMFTFAAAAVMVRRLELGGAA